MKLTDPKPDMTVRIEGRQWAWDLTNPGRDRILGTKDDVRLLNEVRTQRFARAIEAPVA